LHVSDFFSNFADKNINQIFYIMNKEEKFVITISRQFGTGGHEIGAELAKRLGVKLLDKQIMNEVASRFCAVENVVEKIEARNPLWRDDFTQFYRTYMAGREYNGAEHDQTSRELFEAQEAAIRKIAAEESCVIIGRCGFHIFRNHPNALKIFIHADDDCRKKRIARKYDISEYDAAAMLVDNDYSRELYTKTYTGSDWQDARNYDVTINVKKFGVNGAVDFLMHCIG